MCVIILRPWSHQHALIVVVVLIPKIPIEPSVDLDRQTSFRGLKTHRIRRDQCSRCSGRIRKAVALSCVLVDSISCVKRYPRVKFCDAIDKEEMVSREILTAAKRVTHAIEKVLKYRVAINPVVVVASAEREVGSRSPVKRGSKHPRLYVHPEIL